MILVTITTDPTQHPERFNSFLESEKRINCDRYVNDPNIGVVPAMQLLYEIHADQEIICYVHSDVTVYDPTWADRVYDEFKDPKVAVVGFGGATGIGVDDIYKTRYQIEQLQRIGYASNQRDWEVHGSYEAGSRDVAVLDGFFMAVRTSFLKEIGGFEWAPMKFHCYDTATCLQAWRHGWRVRMVGVECMHWGASVSASPEYRRWCLENGTTMELEHSTPHRWLASEFMDMLPLRICQPSIAPK